MRRLWGSPGVSTPIGVRERSVMELDVVRDGPHGLVGGTTMPFFSRFCSTTFGSDRFQTGVFSIQSVSK